LGQYSFTKKLQSLAVIREKMRKTFLYEKGWHKMLVKLTPVVNLSTFLQAAFGPVFFSQKCT